MKITENAKLVVAIIEKYVSKERKESIRKMLESEVGNLYYCSPYSSVKSHGNCFDGGLVVHSLAVFKALRKLNEAFLCGFSDESMAICSLFHAIGRCSITSLKEPYYEEQLDDWKRGRDYLYSVSDSGVYLTTHVRSLFILNAFGVALAPEEYAAIYLHEGMHLNENKSYAYKENKLSIFLSIAHRISLSEHKETTT
jgi:hypothetical protein